MLTFKRGDQLSKKANQILLPVTEGKVSAPEIAKLFDLNLEDELAFFLSADKPLKAGEIFEIPVSAPGFKCERLSFLSLGKLTNSDLRQAGASVGRRLRGKGDVVQMAVDIHVLKARLSDLVDGISGWNKAMRKWLWHK